jgi:hypothetical protein
MLLLRDAAANGGSSLVQLQVETIDKARKFWAFLDHCMYCQDINDLVAERVEFEPELGSVPCQPDTLTRLRLGCGFCRKRNQSAELSR